MYEDPLGFKQEIKFLLKKIKLLRSKNYYFYMRSLESECGTHVHVNGRRIINLGSNNYLGMTFHPKVKEAAIKAINKYGVGSGGVRILSGTYKFHEELEDAIADFKGTESAVVFSTGFMTNAGAIPSLLKPKSLVINDKKNHASIIDGCRFSKAKMRVFRHNDMESLKKILSTYPKEQDKLIIVDSVYSMDGDVANLPDIYKLSKQFNARLMIDEAHATGVLGKTGRGAPEHFNLLGKIDIVSGTLSKAIGALGGFIGSDKNTVTYLKHASREFIFSTSLPPPVAIGALTAIRVIQKEPQLLQQLWKNIRYFRDEIEKMGYDIGNTQSAIIPILIKDQVNTYLLCQNLETAGIFVNPVTFPAVNKKESRIRVSIMAQHSQEDLDTALGAFQRTGKKLKLI